MLEPDTFDRIPKDVAYSIERGYFPSLIERGETFVAYIDRGYWIDIGTPEKYVQVHRDMFDGRFHAGAVRGVDRSRRRWSSPEARIEEGAALEGPCFIDAGAHIKAGARRRPVRGDRPRRRGRGRSARSATASSGRTRGSARTRWSTAPILGRNCHIGRNVSISGTAPCSATRPTLTDYTQSLDGR